MEVEAVASFFVGLAVLSADLLTDSLALNTCQHWAEVNNFTISSRLLTVIWKI